MAPIIEERKMSSNPTRIIWRLCDILDTFSRLLVLLKGVTGSTQPSTFMGNLAVRFRTIKPSQVKIDRGTYIIYIYICMCNTSDTILLSYARVPIRM